MNLYLASGGGEKKPTPVPISLKDVGNVNFEKDVIFHGKLMISFVKL